MNNDEGIAFEMINYLRLQFAHLYFQLVKKQAAN